MRYAMALFLVVPVLTFAQYTENEVMEFITANNSRLWFFDRYQISMASSEKCEGGESYTFHASKKVMHKKCVNGKWQNTESDWSLEKESSFDWWIKMGDKKYELVMTDLPQVKQLHLRDRTGNSKIDPAYDILLKHYIDD